MPPRKSRRPGDVDGPLDADDDILTTVFAYLEPQALLRAATCSRRTLRLLSLDHVVKAVLARGTSTGLANVQNTIKLLRARSIFPPSPLRLLRLACARKCENRFCTASARPKCAREEFGLFWCWPCNRDGGAVQVSRGAYGFALDHERVCKAAGLNHYMWAHPYTRGGERAGPLVTVQVANEARAAAVGNGTTPRAELDAYLAQQPDGADVLELYDRVQAEALAERHARESGQAADAQQRKQAKARKVADLAGSIRALLTQKHGLAEAWAVAAERSSLYSTLTNDLRKAPSKISARRTSEVALALAKPFGRAQAALPLDDGWAFLVGSAGEDDPLARALRAECLRRWPGGVVGMLGEKWPPASLLPPQDKPLLEAMCAELPGLHLLACLLDGGARSVDVGPRAGAWSRARSSVHASDLDLAIASSLSDEPVHLALAIGAVSSVRAQGRAQGAGGRLARSSDVHALREAWPRFKAKYELVVANAARYISLEWRSDERKDADAKLPGGLDWKSYVSGVLSTADAVADLAEANFTRLLDKHQGQASNEHWDYWR